MTYPMAKIMPNLYVGNVVHSMDIRNLNEYSISHIVSVYEKAEKRFPEREYLLIKAYDRDTENLIDYFPKSNDFIHKARLESKNVLVHCVKGVSRSVTIVVAYIMSITNMGWQDALRVVTTNRTMAIPNNGFKKQLDDFEKNGCDAERLRLKSSFESNELYKSDEDICISALKKYYLLFGPIKPNKILEDPDSDDSSEDED